MTGGTGICTPKSHTLCVLLKKDPPRTNRQKSSEGGFHFSASIRRRTTIAPSLHTGGLGWLGKVFQEKYTVVPKPEETQPRKPYDKGTGAIHVIVFFSPKNG